MVYTCLLYTSSPTLAPDTVDAAAVTSNGDISMVNLYLAENPSAVTNSTDTGAGDANTTDASNMQSQDQDQSEDVYKRQVFYY